MTSTIHINEASFDQLVSLWNLSGDEARVVISSRPITSPEELHSIIPERTDYTQLQLEAEKLDINQVGEFKLVRLLGKSAELARTIVANRPYYFLMELRNLPGIDSSTFDRIASLFTGPSFDYVDKISKRSTHLQQQTSDLILQFKEVESGEITEIVRANRIKPYKARVTSEIYQAFSIPETETGTDIIASLKQNPNIEKVIPSFRDEEGERRFIEPEFCIVQFNSNVTEQAQLAILDNLRLEIEVRHRTPGLVTLRIPDGKNNPGEMIAVVQSLNKYQQVKFAEPCYIGVDDRESIAYEDFKVEKESASASLPWNLEMIDISEAWQYSKGGSEIIIAIIDSGIDENHPALKTAIEQRKAGDDWDFTSEDSLPVDEEGHGTFIAGLLVGNGDLGIYGICPFCRILPLKISTVSSPYSYAQRRDAILYALDYVPSNKRLIINISWKTSGDVALIRDAISIAESRNAFVVASAGNWPERADQPHYPSDYSPILSVGAVDPRKIRSQYSFYGGGVDLAAPGGSGSSADLENLLSAAVGGITKIDFGTSFAAPHVAGLAGLIWSQNKDLSPHQVREIIEQTCVPLNDNGLGSGLIDATAAVKRTQHNLPSTGNQGTPSTNSGNLNGLYFVNNDDLETLANRYGLAMITARLLIARRPFSRIEEIRGTLGLTEVQYARIANLTIGTSEESGAGLGTTNTGGAPQKIIDVNQASLEELDALPEMPTLSARLIIVRRPHTSIEKLLSISGMKESLLKLLKI